MSTATIAKSTAKSDVANAVADAVAAAKITGTAAVAAEAAVNANLRFGSTIREAHNIAQGLDKQFGETVVFIGAMLDAGVSTRPAAQVLNALPGGGIKADKSSISNYSTVAKFVALAGDLPTVKGKDADGNEVQKATHILRPDPEKTTGLKSVYAAILKITMPGDAKAACDAAGIKTGKAVAEGIIASSKDKAEAVQGLDELAKKIADAKRDADKAAKDPKTTEVLLKSASEGIIAAALESATKGFLGDPANVLTLVTALEGQLAAIKKAASAK